MGVNNVSFQTRNEQNVFEWKKEEERKRSISWIRESAVFLNRYNLSKSRISSMLTPLYNRSDFPRAFHWSTRSDDNPVVVGSPNSWSPCQVKYTLALKRGTYIILRDAGIPTIAHILHEFLCEPGAYPSVLHVIRTPDAEGTRHTLTANRYACAVNHVHEWKEWKIEAFSLEVSVYLFFLDLTVQSVHHLFPSHMT